MYICGLMFGVIGLVYSVPAGAGTLAQTDQGI